MGVPWRAFRGLLTRIGQNGVTRQYPVDAGRYRINGAPALVTATVGLAFGHQSEIRTEAAGAVIMDTSLKRVMTRSVLAPTADSDET